MGAALNNTGHGPPPIWRGIPVPVIAGLGDTRKKAGAPYAVRPLGEIFQAKACRLPKERAPAFLPSTYAESDARAHEAQRERGSFVALVGDVDKGDHPLSRVRALVEGFANGSAWMIYSTASATPSGKRWRVVLPLDGPVSFGLWYDAQLALTAHMVAGSVEMDTCAARPGQVSFLPNVPSEMCDEAGEPVFFQQASSDPEAAGLQLHTGLVAAGIEAIGRQRKADDAERERIRREAERRRKARPTSSNDASVIDTFNRSNSVENLLALYEYDQSPRDRRDWKSRYQTSGTFATRVLDGGKWVSLSGSDASAGVGAQCSSGCYGDAYDLFVHYDHGGDRNAAWKAACEEQGRGRPPRANDNLGDDWRWQEAGEPDHGPDPETSDADGETTPNLPIATLDLSALAGVTPKPKLFAVERLAPLGETTLFTGPGSAGKSLLGQQIATCGAAGIPCLGLHVMSGPTMYLTCEDDEEQLHFRQAAICAALNVPMASLAGSLHLVSLRGALDNELCTFDSNGALKPSDGFWRLVKMLKATGTKLAILDNVAHLFTGNENDRGDVTRFANLLNKLAQETGAAIILLAHPNKAGDSYSGSTAWLNAVRSQIYMEHDLDTDVRTLTVGKANYSRKGESLRFIWHEWAFVREADLPPETARALQETIAATGDNEVFIRCLRERTRQRRAVSEKQSATYAPTVFAGMAESKGLGKARLEKAMDRLFRVDRIERAELWKGDDRKPVFGLRETVRGGAGDGHPQDPEDF